MTRDSVPIVVLLLVLVLMLPGGCISGPSRNGTSEPGNAPDLFSQEGDSPPSVYITYPDFDGGVDAGNVTVTVLVRNFSVVNRIGKSNRVGEGHIVYFKDVVPPTKPGFPAMTGPGTFQISAQTWCTWYNVSMDTHTFAVELVNNDNTPLVPPVIDAVDVTAVHRLPIQSDKGFAHVVQ